MEKQYIVVIDEPVEDQRVYPAGVVPQQWPKVMRVPPPVTRAAQGTEYTRTETEQRNQHPEKWMVTVVLPSHPGSKCTLYESRASYSPATHKKDGD